MKEKLLDLLACPTCGGDILLAYASKYEDKEIIEGVLTCKNADREYKVVRGVPRFADLGQDRGGQGGDGRELRLAVDPFHAGGPSDIANNSSAGFSP